MQKIAIQGIAGSFHHQACEEFFGTNYTLAEQRNFKNLVQSLENHQADFGIMAIENSIAGAILPNYALILNHQITIVGEVYLPIRLHLVAKQNASLESIKEVYSHRMALLESDQYLNQFQQWNLTEKYDTASSAQYVAQQQSANYAAVASDMAAKLYKLKILQENIQNTDYNYTRFFVLSSKAQSNLKFNKVSICFELDHQSGKLMRILSKMVHYRMNLTKIQSLPIPEKPFSYRFFVDVIIPNQDDYFMMLETLKKITKNLNILGAYQENYFQDYFIKTKHLFNTN